MTTCDRCGRETAGTIMSRFSTDLLCLDCEDAEKLRPGYAEARRAEEDAVHRGDLNFPGVEPKTTPPPSDRA